jgi:mannonate dehydratase
MQNHHIMTGMKFTFRWYGENDRVTLKNIRQIPVIKGIVSALNDIPAGEVWPLEGVLALKKRVEESGLELSAIESISVHEDIKLGGTKRDEYLENYCESIRNIAKAGIRVLCYNFMPVFDWMRTDLNKILPDGSSCLDFNDGELAGIINKMEKLDMPAWAQSYTREKLMLMLETYKGVTDEDLWANLGYFLKAVVPVAGECGVRMGIHPDDPPWPIMGLPRIITGEASLARLLAIVDSPFNGITLCTGSLGPSPENDLCAIIKKFKGRIPFVHARNIERSGPRKFNETAHPSTSGSLDMYEIMKALYETGFDGIIRPDHGRMIWGETGKPGYGLYDRALGAMYLAGLWEAIVKNCGE